MRNTKKPQLLLTLASASILAVTMSACSQGTTPQTAPTMSYVSVSAAEPQKSLIPTTAYTDSEIKISRLLFSGLIYYDRDGNIRNDIATSITHDKQCMNYDIEIAAGLRFSDGSEIRAQNFVKSWSYASHRTNNPNTTDLFNPIAGYDPQSNKTLNGIETINDHHFLVHLNKPNCDFLRRLGHPAFAPLPNAAFDHPDKVTAFFGENPFGYGPYTLAKDGAWEHGSRLTLLPNERYRGPRQAKNDGIVMNFFISEKMAYEDLLTDTLDVDETDLPEGIKTFPKEMSSRFNKVSAAELKYLLLPNTGSLDINTPDGKMRRQAISMAINRQDICDKTIPGGCAPAQEFSAAVAQRKKPSLPVRQALSYNPKEAEQLWKTAEKISPWDGTLTIGYDESQDDKLWVETIAASIRATAGIPVETKPFVSEYLLNEQLKFHPEMAYPVSWRAQYPSAGAFLEPVFASYGTQNMSGYNNPRFDQLLELAFSQEDLSAGELFFDQAQDVLREDFPLIPLWSPQQHVGWSTQVQKIKLNWDGIVQHWNISRY